MHHIKVRVTVKKVVCDVFQFAQKVAVLSCEAALHPPTDHKTIYTN